MKRFLSLLIALCCLSGCGTEQSLDPVLTLRQQLQQTPAAFDCRITADYGEETYTFAMGCQLDAHGNLSFQVTEPEAISGITGKVEAGQGSLLFDSTVLSFPLLADGLLSPASAPWILFTAIRSGYMQSAGPDGDLTMVRLKDSYGEDAFQAELWLDGDHKPVRGEILWKDRRILALSVSNFRFL